MTDPAVLIPSVDALHAHFVEWVRFLDAKGQELEAQLARLEASKKKKSNVMGLSADGSVITKVLPRTAPASAGTVRESASPNPVDWLDDGSGNSQNVEQPVPQIIPPPVDASDMDIPVHDEDHPSDDEDDSTNDPALASGFDAEIRKVLPWLEGK